MDNTTPTATVARRRLRVTRDGVLFVVGLAGIIYEALVNHGENATLLIVFSAMCGLPAFLRGDEILGKREVGPKPKPEPEPNGESAA